MASMVWVAFIGVVLQVVGLVIAILGVAKTYRETEGSSLAGGIVLSAQKWFERVVLRKKEDKPAVELAPDNLVITSSVEAKLRTEAPSDDAPQQEWIAYLNRRTEQLDRQVEEARKHAEAVAASAEKRVKQQLSRLEDRVQKVDSVARAAHHASIGPDGAGLRETAVGLAITAFGVALTLAGLPW